MHRILIVGDSLFADTLRQMLTSHEQIEVTGACRPVKDLPATIAACGPDAVVLADPCATDLHTGIWLGIQCDLPIIHTTLTDDHLTIFTSRRVKAAQAQLLAAITALPNRR